MARKFGKQAGYVYIAHCSGFYKIGRSINPHSRVGQIQTDNPHQVELV